MKRLLLLALIPALLFACEETDLPLESRVDVTMINGSWDWVNSGKTISDQVIQPINDLEIVGNVFILDHRLIVEQGRLTIRVDNDSPDWLAVKEAAIEFQENTDDPIRPFLLVSSNQMNAIPDIGGVFEFGDYFIVQKATEDELVLLEAGDCEDCWIHTFERTN